MPGANFFSIVVPTYNRADFLIKAIQSVLQQTFIDWELIVVDDGSTDNTREIVGEVKDARIRYLYQQNAERSAARNHGIRCAAGTYICFLDSDDQYLPDHLESLHSYLIEKKLPSAMLFTDYIQQENDFEARACHTQYEGDPAAFFLQNVVIPSSVCMHCDILGQIQFDEKIKVVEDTVMWIRVANCFPVHHLTCATVTYLIHEDNSVNLKNNAFQYRLKGLQKLFKEVDYKTVTPALRNEALSSCYYGMGKHYYFTRQFFPMVKALWQSFLKNPIHRHNKAKMYMVKSYLFGPKIEHF